VNVCRQIFGAIATTLCVASFSHAGQQFGRGRYVEWIPGYESQIPAYAAVGRSILTVVVYNPRLMSTLPAEQARFELYRHDAVAYLAADQLRVRGEYGSAFGSPRFDLNSQARPYMPIDEQMFYGHPKLRGMADLGLDCVAYQALAPFEQRALRDLFASTERRSSSPPSSLPRLRRLSMDTQRFLESDECARLAFAFE